MTHRIATLHAGSVDVGRTADVWLSLNHGRTNAVTSQELRIRVAFRGCDRLQANTENTPLVMVQNIPADPTGIGRAEINEKQLQEAFAVSPRDDNPLFRQVRHIQVAHNGTSLQTTHQLCTSTSPYGLRLSV